MQNMQASTRKTVAASPLDAEMVIRKPQNKLRKNVSTRNQSMASIFGFSVMVIKTVRSSSGPAPHHSPHRTAGIATLSMQLSKSMNEIL